MKISISIICLFCVISCSSPSYYSPNKKSRTSKIYKPEKNHLSVKPSFASPTSSQLNWLFKYKSNTNDFLVDGIPYEFKSTANNQIIKRK